MKRLRKRNNNGRLVGSLVDLKGEVFFFYFWRMYMILSRIKKKIKCGKEKNICHTEKKNFFDMMFFSKYIEANVQKKADNRPI